MKTFLPTLHRNWKYLTYDGEWIMWDKKPRFDDEEWDFFGTCCHAPIDQKDLFTFPKLDPNRKTDALCIWKIEQ